MAATELQTLRSRKQEVLADPWLLVCQLPKNRHPNTDSIFTKPDKGFEVPPDADSIDYKSPNN